MPLKHQNEGGSICGEMNICSKFVPCLRLLICQYMYEEITLFISDKSEESAKRSIVKQNKLASTQE